MAGTQTDISDKKLIDEMKDNFISNVSHELRTPLTASKAAIEMITAGAIDPLTENGQKLLQITVRNINRLLYLVNDILEMERLSAHKIKIHTQEGDLAETIGESIEENLSFAMQYGVSIQFDKPAAAIRMQFDPERIKQVMSNLLSNAAKFSETDGVIDVKIETRDTCARVYVIDHGKGIADKFQERIFTRFEKVDPDNTEVQKSSGLGLFISKSLIELHGGSIGFVSKEGEGSTFHFELPLEE